MSQLCLLHDCTKQRTDGPRDAHRKRAPNEQANCAGDDRRAAGARCGRAQQ